ncbi:hypothetical protein HK104_002733 [Borealophlyctis nickersoniae]|nr:hypothetical protein HK104_002733 [Borealophlyctis nickersoniae]
MSSNASTQQQNPPVPYSQDHPHLSAAKIAHLQTPLPHPLNPSAERTAVRLGDAVGLTHLGVHLNRVSPGKESTVFHRHLHEEECFYILSGRGIATIEKQCAAAAAGGDGGETGGVVETEQVDIGPGDFLGFKRGGPAHSFKAVGEEDLLYLVCGERADYDLVEYPLMGKKFTIDRVKDERAFSEL